MPILNRNLLSKIFPKSVGLFEQANNNVILQQYIKNKSAKCLTVPVGKKHDYFKFVNDEIIKNVAIDYLEFGVYEGGSIIDWPKINTNDNSRFFAFDKFPPKYPIPQIDDQRVCFVKGLFQDRLREFLQDFKPKNKLVIFINLDKNYDTLFCLSQLDSILNENCLIMFDQFSKLQGEVIGFHNYIKSFRRNFSFICQSMDWKRVTVELLPQDKFPKPSKKLESYEPSKNLESGVSKKKANVIFLLIDGLRLDKFSGKNRACHTPNIDMLVTKSVFFNSAISSADGTFTSMGSIFTSQYPHKTGITWANNHSKSRKIFENLKLSGYELHATIPNYDFFRTLSKSFKEENCDLFNAKISGLSDNVGEIILKHLNKMKSPWFYYIHVMDLHTSRPVSSNFNSKIYGDNEYERKLSLIDSWIGKILDNVDLENTFFIVTSDHGEYVLDNKMRPDFIPIIQQKSLLQNDKSKSSKSLSDRIITYNHEIQVLEKKRNNLSSDSEIDIINKKISEITEKRNRELPLSWKVGSFGFKTSRKILANYRKKKFQKSLNSYEIRSTYKRGKNYLYDEAIRIPLLFFGAGIKQHKIISHLVRHVDIFPTIADICKFPINKKQMDGRSLLPLIHDDNLNEIPAIIETMPVLVKPAGDVIGLRTSNFKYFRSRENPLADVHLFDLINDPKEIKNIAQSNPRIVEEMELILGEERNKNEVKVEEKLNDKRKSLALKTLKEMGYD